MREPETNSNPGIHVERPKTQIFLISPSERRGQEIISVFLPQAQVHVESGWKEEWVQWIQQGRSDAVFMDVDIDGTDTYEVCRLIKTQCDIPVILFGDNLTDDALTQGFEYGADEMIALPVKGRKEEQVRVNNVIKLGEVTRKNRELSAQLAEMTNRLETADDRKKQMMKIVGHDMRNPLNGIIGITNLIRTEEVEDPEELEQMLSLVESSGETLLEQINRLLGVLRADFNQDNLDITDTDIPVLVEKIYQLQLPTARKKKISFNRKIDPELKRVKIDAKKVEHIIGDLVRNAIKFTPTEGWVDLRVHVDGTGEGRHLVITVRDSGIGLPYNSVEELIEKGESAQRKGTDAETGYGLGLSVIKKFVDLHDGQIKVDSEQDKGTEITVKLPDRQLNNKPD